MTNHSLTPESIVDVRHAIREMAAAGVDLNIAIVSAVYDWQARRIAELEKRLSPPPPVETITRRPEDYEYWAKCVYPEGMTAEQVQNELADFRFMMQQVPKVYYEVTGGKLTKPMYYADTVIGEFHRHLEDLIEEAIKEDREERLSQPPPNDLCERVGRALIDGFYLDRLFDMTPEDNAERIIADALPKLKAAVRGVAEPTGRRAAPDMVTCPACAGDGLVGINTLEKCDHCAGHGLVELRTAPPPPPVYHAPIAKLRVGDDDSVTATLYAPGLPPGEHDVYPEAGLTHWDKQYAHEECGRCDTGEVCTNQHGICSRHGGMPHTEPEVTYASFCSRCGGRDTTCHICGTNGTNLDDRRSYETSTPTSED